MRKDQLSPSPQQAPEAAAARRSAQPIVDDNLTAISAKLARL
jgi:hypothetical protein